PGGVSPGRNTPPRGSRHSPGGSAHLREALEWNEKAEGCFSEGKAPPALYLQRGELLHQAGATGEARRWQARGQTAKLGTARDHSLAARELAASGKFRAAARLLKVAVRLEPRNFWASFLLGYCHEGLGQDADAVASYTAAITLAPDFPGGYEHRGRCHLNRK